MVVGGVLKLDENTTTRQERGVEKLRVHPNFNSITLHNDVAVLQVRLCYIVLQISRYSMFS